MLEPSSRRYPASAAEAHAKRCLYSPGAAAVVRIGTRRRSRIRPGPVRAGPLSGRQPATAGPAGALPKARMAVGRPLAVPAVKENSQDAFVEVLSAVYRADFRVFLRWESWEFRP